MSGVRSILRAPEITGPVALLVVALLFVLIALWAFPPEPAIAAAVITATAALYAPVLSLILSRYFERRRELAQRALDSEREIAQRQRELELEVRGKKVPIYENFIDFWFTVLFAEKLGRKPLSERDIVRRFYEFTKPLTIWGSDDVIRQWGRMRVEFAALADDPKADRIEPVFKFEQLLLAFRRDSGYPDTTLGRGDILRLIINDIDDVMARQASEWSPRVSDEC